MQILQALVLACVVLFGVHVQGRLPIPMCATNPQATVGPDDPRLPMLPLQYEAHVEGAIIDQSMTVTADEYVSVIMGALSLKITKGGNSEIVILNINTNEMYHILDSECTVYNQSTDLADVLFGGASGVSSMPHTFSTASVLMFAQKYGEVYKGQSTVRGIQCDHWQSCMYWGNLGVNFTLDYYFSVPNWNTAGGSPQVPVRAEVVGYQNLEGPGPGSSFHQIYDYTGYKSYLTDITVFQTPVGVACAGRRQTRRMPQLKPQYRYRQEVTHLSEQMVYQEDVWYDYNLQLVRWDHRPTHKNNHYNTLDAITEIHDFNTGLAYIIYKDFPRCNFYHIQNDTWDAAQAASTSSLRLKPPEGMFSLGSSYAYSGQRTVRGIACDVYSAVRTDYGSLQGLNVTFEIYFMSHDWHSANDIGNDPDSTDTPVRLDISEPTTSFGIIYDYYDFDQTHPDVINAFDITTCYNDAPGTDFQITFPGNPSSILPQQETVLRDVGRVSIASAARLTPLRIQNLEVHWGENDTYLIGTLLDQAPLTAGAGHEVGRGQAYRALANAVTSGQLGIVVPHGNTSTVLNATGITTDIWRQGSPGSQYSSKLAVLHHFTFSANRALPRGDGNTILTGLSLEDCASQCLAHLIFSCQTFQYQPSSGKCSLSSELPDTSHAVTHTEASHVYTRDYTLGFSALYNTYIGNKSFSETHPNIPTVNSCAQLCIRASMTIPCTSFNYAQKYGTCILESHDRNDVSPSDIVSSTVWDNYLRMHYPDGSLYLPHDLSQKTCRQTSSTSKTQATTTDASAPTKTTPTGKTISASTQVPRKTEKPTPCACVCNKPTTPTATPPTATYTGGLKTSSSSSGTQCGETSPSKPSPATGTIVGTAIAMLILGGILGGIIVFFIQRRREGNMKSDMYISNPVYSE